jgi:hypothetical protein
VLRVSLEEARPDIGGGLVENMPEVLVLLAREAHPRCPIQGADDGKMQMLFDRVKALL